MTSTFGLKPLDRPDDYEFRCDGVSVGRTYKQSVPGGVNWYWSIYGVNLKGVLPDGVPVQGTGIDLEAAKAIFKSNFEKLIANGNVKIDR